MGGKNVSVSQSINIAAISLTFLFLGAIILGIV